MSYYPDWCTGKEKLLCIDKIDAYAPKKEESYSEAADAGESGKFGEARESGKFGEAGRDIGGSALDELVLGIIKKTPMAALDRCMLYGIVYEKLLGRFRAGQYSLLYCMEHYRELSLPCVREIDSACRQAVRACVQE